jgi:purine nucleoside permease
MEIKVSFKAIPFTVPDKVYIETPSPINDGSETIRTMVFESLNKKLAVNLQDLDEEVLNALCDQFRIDVFKAANKTITTITAAPKKIKIISCPASTYWYSDRIGEIFDVEHFNESSKTCQVKDIYRLDTGDGVVERGYYEVVE